jgi:sugar phosphate isomerase/epimerase
VKSEQTRRTFLKTAAIVAGGEALGPWEQAAAARAATVARAPGLRLGVASYSLRNFPRAKAIEMLGELRARYVNIKSMHLPYNAGTAEIAAARAEFAAAGIEIVGGGTITFEEDSDASVNAYFAYAKSAGMPVIVATCDPKILPRVERHAVRYDIKVAIHNHGPEDTHYPAPSDALKYVRSMDARMGVCIDLGHTVRTGTDVVAAIREAGPRLHDLHLKDLRDLRNAASQCVVGEGAMPIPAILRELVTMRFTGCANLEYEIEANNPLPGMQRSLAYLRGVLAGLEAPLNRG